MTMMKEVLEIYAGMASLGLGLPGLSSSATFVTCGFKEQKWKWDINVIS